MKKPSGVTGNEDCVASGHPCSFTRVQLVLELRPFYPICRITVVNPIGQFLSILRIVSTKPSSEESQKFRLFSLSKAQGVRLQFR